MLAVDTTDARLAVAAPLVLLSAVVGVAASSRLFDVDSLGAPLVYFLLLPLACATWMFWRQPRPRIVALALLSSLFSAFVFSVLLASVLALFAGEGGELAGSGIWLAVGTSFVCLLFGSLVLRSKSGLPVFGLWLAWFIPAGLGIAWGALTVRLADIGMGATPWFVDASILGLSIWLGVILSAVIGAPLFREPVT